MYLSLSLSLSLYIYRCTGWRAMLACKASNSSRTGASANRCESTPICGRQNQVVLDDKTAKRCNFANLRNQGRDSAISRVLKTCKERLQTHIKCFLKALSEVNSPTNPST